MTTVALDIETRDIETRVPVQPMVRVVLLILVLWAYGWRVQALSNQSLWRDEVDAIYFALRDLPETLSMFVAAAQNGPLYFLSLRGWFYLVGATEFTLRYPSALAGVLGMLVLWQVTRRLVTPTAATAVYGQAVPLLAAAFFAINPYQLWYAREGKMYALATLLALLAHWWWLQGIDRGGWRPWLLYLITVSVAMYSHLLMIIIIPLHLLWFLLAWPQSRAHWRGYGLALAGLTLPYLPLLIWQWAMLLATTPQSGFSFVDLPTMAESLLWSHSYGLLSRVPWLRMLPLWFVGLAGVILGLDALQAHKTGNPWVLAPWRRYALILSWLLAPIAIIYLLSLRHPVYTDRYIIWIGPAALILLALGVRVIAQNAGLLARPLVLIFVLYIGGLWLYADWQQQTQTIKYDLRSGVTYIAERRAPETKLILQIPYLEWAYRYYTGNFQADLFVEGDRRLGNWVGGIWSNNGLPDDQARGLAEQEITELTAGVDELWLLTSEVEMWDARHFLLQWLDAHGTLVEKAEFHGIQAWHYQLVDKPAD